MFAISAKSTHLGCTVGFNKGLGASRDVADYDGDGLPDGRMLDPCHQDQWDVFHRGVAMPNQFAQARMALLDLHVQDGQLVGTHYDGPVGPQPR
jgi:Rieske Fe-S protein